MILNGLQIYFILYHLIGSIFVVQVTCALQFFPINVWGTFPENVVAYVIRNPGELKPFRNKMCIL